MSPMNKAEQAIVMQAIVLLTVMLEDSQAEEACPKCGGRLVLTAKKNRLKCSRNTGSDGGCGYSTIKVGARSSSAPSTARYTPTGGRA